MLGKAAVAMWWDIAPEVRAEWEDWHTREHMPERLSIPGFLRGTRWIAASGQPSYFVLYEAERLETLTAGTYLERLNNPTPWSLKMMPHHRNMVRSLCEVRDDLGRRSAADAGDGPLFAYLRDAQAAAASMASPALTCSSRCRWRQRHKPRNKRFAVATRAPTGCC